MLTHEMPNMYAQQLHARLLKSLYWNNRLVYGMLLIPDETRTHNLPPPPPQLHTECFNHIILGLKQSSRVVWETGYGYLDSVICLSLLSSSYTEWFLLDIVLFGAESYLIFRQCHWLSST